MCRKGWRSNWIEELQIVRELGTNVLNLGSNNLESFSHPEENVDWSYLELALRVYTIL